MKFLKNRKSEYCVDRRNPSEVFLVVNRQRDYVVLERENGTFTLRGHNLLEETTRKINPKRIRKGSMVKLVNTHNDYNKKKLIVYDVCGEMVTLLTDNGRMTVSLLTVKMV